MFNWVKVLWLLSNQKNDHYCPTCKIWFEDKSARQSHEIEVHARFLVETGTTVHTQNTTVADRQALQPRSSDGWTMPLEENKQSDPEKE